MICPNCNATVPDGVSFCEYCGAPLRDAASAQAQPAGAAPSAQAQPAEAAPGAQAQYQQPSYGQAGAQPAGQQTYQQPGYGQPAAAASPGTKNKLAAGLLAIFLGSLGIHKFYLGYTKAGVIMLVVTLVGSIFTFGLAALAMEVIGIVEGIMYLVKTDWDFYQTYEVGEKQWF